MKKYLSVFTLLLALSVPTLAGVIEMPGDNPPPPPVTVSSYALFMLDLLF
jgi:hypothetical protein